MRTVLIFFLLFNFKAYAQQKDLAEVYLISDVKEYKAGEPFKLAIKFVLEPGWHIYWRYPGKIGLPTSFEVKPIDGVEISEFKFPIPKEFKQAKEEIAYGYENEVAFLAEVFPNEKLDKNLDFNIDAKWLFCSSSMCVPGQKKLSLLIPPAKNSILISQDRFINIEKNLPINIEDERSFVRLSSYKERNNSIDIKLEWRQRPDDLKILFSPTRRVVVNKIKSSFDGLISNHQIEISKSQDLKEPKFLLVSYTIDNQKRYSEMKIEN